MANGNKNEFNEYLFEELTGNEYNQHQQDLKTLDSLLRARTPEEARIDSLSSNQFVFRNPGDPLIHPTIQEIKQVTAYDNTPLSEDQMLDKQFEMGAVSEEVPTIFKALADESVRGIAHQIAIDNLSNKPWLTAEEAGGEHRNAGSAFYAALMKLLTGKSPYGNEEKTKDARTRSK
jgi:hypothetical protein